MRSLDVGIQSWVGALRITVTPTYHMQIPCCRGFLDFVCLTPSPEGQSQMTHDEITPGIHISTWVGNWHAHQCIQRNDTFGHEVLEDSKLNLGKPPGIWWANQECGDPCYILVYQLVIYCCIKGYEVKGHKHKLLI